ncbi:MAG: hypothetical protein Ct9H300mP28_24770 [Pseudomonadota bacterium]|nr:MAG: hypothetical protein Ct9H300mP28_24770 [Pseudomonadota bacterium]
MNFGLILAPMVQERKGEYRKELEEWAAQGFVRARVERGGQKT